MMLHLQNPDLASDSEACWVVKHEVVWVDFAAAPGDHGIVAAARFDSVYRVRDPD
jgi:hypothetical protein